MEIGEIGYIYYKDRIIQVKLVEKHGNYRVVATEDNELLGIPAESGTHIWSTREECEIYEGNPWGTFTPQNHGDN